MKRSSLVPDRPTPAQIAASPPLSPEEKQWLGKHVRELLGAQRRAVATHSRYAHLLTTPGCTEVQAEHTLWMLQSLLTPLICARCDLPYWISTVQLRRVLHRIGAKGICRECALSDSDVHLSGAEPVRAYRDAARAVVRRWVGPAPGSLPRLALLLCTGIEVESILLGDHADEGEAALEAGRLLDLCGGDADSAGEVYLDARNRLRGILWNHWLAIDALAGSLIDHLDRTGEQLDEAAIDALLDADLDNATHE